MSGHYARNPHDDAPDASEQRDRAERLEQEAASWFWDLVGPQKQRFSTALNDAFPYRNTPRGARMIAAAHRDWSRSTAAAKAVYQMALADLGATGEISEATNDAYEAVKAGVALAQATRAADAGADGGGSGIDADVGAKIGAAIDDSIENRIDALPEQIVPALAGIAGDTDADIDTCIAPDIAREPQAHGDR